MKKIFFTLLPAAPQALRGGGKAIFLLWVGLSLVWAPAAAGAVEKAEIWPAGNGLIEPGLFRATTGEQKSFVAAFALPGRPEGLRRGEKGPAVYCEFVEEPLEFHWGRAPSAVGDEKLALGYGEITLKYAGEQLVLQRYRGEFKNGYREGRGELLGREPRADNAFIYRGEFRKGRLNGRGVYISTDFRQGGESPFIYEGEFENDTFHGQGIMADLTTGRVIHSGLWFEGFPFQ